MKKYIHLTLVLSLCQLIGNAQISLLNTDIAGTGSTFYYATDLNPSISIGGTGSQTWSYTNLATTQNDTLITVLPGTTPYGASFPSANLCLQIGSTDNYYYFNTNNDSITSPGDALNDYFNGAVTRTFTPEKLTLKFPVNYTNSYTRSVYRYGRFPYPGAVIDSLEEKKNQLVEVTADAYGTLATSLGTFQVLRVRETVYNSDSVFKHDPVGGWQFLNTNMDTVVTYDYWAKNIGLPVVRITASATGDIEDVLWLKQLPGSTGFEKADFNEALWCSMVPNLLDGTLQIHSKGEPIRAIRLYNTLGAMCLDKKGLQETSQKVNISSLPFGIYFVEIESISGKKASDKIYIGR